MGYWPCCRWLSGRSSAWEISFVNASMCATSRPVHDAHPGLMWSAVWWITLWMRQRRRWCDGTVQWRNGAMVRRRRRRFRMLSLLSGGLIHLLRLRLHQQHLHQQLRTVIIVLWRGHLMIPICLWIQLLGLGTAKGRHEKRRHQKTEWSRWSRSRRRSSLRSQMGQILKKHQHYQLMTMILMC